VQFLAPPESEDTMGTTAKALGLAAAIVAAVALVAANFTTISAPDPRIVAAVHAETERVYAEIQADNEARYREAYIRHVYAVHGDAAGDLYVHCTGPEPPSQPANQEKCKVLLDRLQREDEAAAAADAKKKASW
jgi:hypothetical protein